MSKKAQTILKEKYKCIHTYCLPERLTTHSLRRCLEKALTLVKKKFNIEECLDSLMEQGLKDKEKPLLCIKKFELLLHDKKDLTPQQKEILLESVNDLVAKENIAKTEGRFSPENSKVFVKFLKNIYDLCEYEGNVSHDMVTHNKLFIYYKDQDA